MFDVHRAPARRGRLRPWFGWLFALALSMAIWPAPAAPTSGSDEPAAPAAAPSSGPRAEFEATEIDLGNVTRGDSAEGGYTIRNAGDEPLRILKVKPG